MNYYVQVNDEAPVFKGSLSECTYYRDHYCGEGKIVSEQELYIENN